MLYTKLKVAGEIISVLFPIFIKGKVVLYQLKRQWWWWQWKVPFGAALDRKWFRSWLLCVNRRSDGNPGKRLESPKREKCRASGGKKIHGVVDLNSGGLRCCLSQCWMSILVAQTVERARAVGSADLDQVLIQVSDYWEWMDARWLSVLIYKFCTRGETMSPSQPFVSIQRNSAPKALGSTVTHLDSDKC